MIEYDEEELKTAEIAWKMFETTGNLSYYMLYKNLKK